MSSTINYYYDMLVSGTSVSDVLDRLVENMLDTESKEIEEGFGAIYYNYYNGGNSVGVSSQRSFGNKEWVEFLGDYPDDKLADLVGKELADKIIEFKKSKNI
jgi:hypothetical protein